MSRSGGRPAPVSALGLICSALLVASFGEGAWAAWVLALGAALVPAVLVALATRRGGAVPLAVPVGLALLLAGSAAGVLWLGRPAAADVRFGLPGATWLMALGLCAVPMVWLVGWYIVRFDRWFHGPED